MDRATRYQFADFTLSNYRDLVRLARSRYAFRGYNDFEPNERLILWRHDVDMSVHRAIKLAQVEGEEGVRATYFLHLHSEFYNILEREVNGLAKELVSLGHDIGLHFDGHFYGEIQVKHELEDLLARETR